MAPSLFFFKIFKVYIEFVTTLLLLHVLVFLASRHVRSQHPDQGRNLYPVLEGKILPTGLLEKFQFPKF